MPSSDSPQGSRYRNLDRGRAFQVGESPVDQIEADVRRSIVAPFAVCVRLGQLNGLRSDLGLCQATLLGDALDRVTITVAGRKLHRAINVLRIAAQYSLDDADAFDEIAPVDRAQEAKTSDAIADRDLVRCLLLVLRLHQLFDRQMRFREPLLYPRQCKRQRRTLSLQTARKLR